MVQGSSSAGRTPSESCSNSDVIFQIPAMDPNHSRPQDSDLDFPHSKAKFFLGSKGREICILAWQLSDPGELKVEDHISLANELPLTRADRDGGYQFSPGEHESALLPEKFYLNRNPAKETT